ncbi:C-X-C chemokine receptor type 3-like [Embiotoca jacksoni]|uniref:C-X-C chemokine receptor type 3-like n=1 Tax=Embiotoca jacksoni TaxID=100190 RepID=UPI003704CB3A
MKMDVDLDGMLGQNTSYDYDYNYEYKEDSEPRGCKPVWIPVLFSVVLVVGLLGNILLLAVLAQKRRSWSKSDTFILHMCVADILLLVTLPFWAAQSTQHCELCFGILYKLCRAVFSINFYCGIFLLVCISLDHCQSTIHAIQLFYRKPWLVHISCLSVWLVSLLLTIPDWISPLPEEGPAEEKTLCVPSYSQSVNNGELRFRLVQHTMGFVLPAATLIICCSCFLYQLQCSFKSLQKQRALMVILPLVVMFFLCWMPYNITLIVDSFRKSSKEHNDVSRAPDGSLDTALMVTSALGCIHACLRPLLYLSLRGNFRKRLLAMLKCVTFESKSSVWELGVGEEAPPD